MINRKVDDAVFDVILTHAFREAFAQEMEQIEAEDSQPAQPSEKHRKHERAYYKKMRRKPIKVMTIVRGTAACVAAVICLSFGAMMFSPPVRAAVVDTLVGFFEKYVAVDVDVDKDSKAIFVGEYTMNYVPHGFELVDRSESSAINRYKFSNGSEYFKLCFYETKDSLLKFDMEQGNTTQLEINGELAYLIQNENGYSILVWIYDGKTMSVEGVINIKTMQNIAKNIS
ncbi:MAG: DUF4367 domain-containing protein [Clostridia bacterium]|nr:DUF4367 domain-containing protein [Clostridia bacterium]